MCRLPSSSEDGDLARVTLDPDRDGTFQRHWEIREHWSLAQSRFAGDRGGDEGVEKGLVPVVMVSVVYREGGPEGPAALGEAVVFGEFTVELRLKTSRVEWLRIASGTLTQEAWPSSGPTQSSSETRGLAAHTGSR